MFFIDKRVCVYSEIITDSSILNSATKGFTEQQASGETRPKINVYSSYLSPFDVHKKTDKFDSLITRILHRTEDLAHDVFLLDRPYHCHQLWLAQYEAGDYALNHNHFPVEFVATFYLDNTCDPIIFEDDISLCPKAGELLIFPGFVQHKVPEVKHTRRVVALNLSSATG